MNDAKKKMTVDKDCLGKQNRKVRHHLGGNKWAFVVEKIGEPIKRHVYTRRF